MRVAMCECKIRIHFCEAVELWCHCSKLLFIVLVWALVRLWLKVLAQKLQGLGLVATRNPLYLLHNFLV